MRLDINSGKQMSCRVTFVLEVNSPAIVWLFNFSHFWPQTLLGNDKYLIKELFEPESNNTSNGRSDTQFCIIFEVSIVNGIKSDF